jgi:hypothetical protein
LLHIFVGISEGANAEQQISRQMTLKECPTFFCKRHSIRSLSKKKLLLKMHFFVVSEIVTKEPLSKEVVAGINFRAQNEF